MVDDDDLVVMALEELLTPAGYEVTTAYDGLDALKKLEGNSFDLIILDIIMPRMNGFEVCARIRESEQYRSVPIIMLTAKSSPEDKKKGIDVGADLFLPKPIGPQRLLDLVKSATE